MSNTRLGESEDEDRIAVLEQALTAIVLQFSALCPAAPYEDLLAVLINCGRIAGDVLQARPGRIQFHESDSLIA